MSLQEFKDKLSSVNKNILVIGDVYKDNKTKISVKCLKCNHEWDATPNNLLRGSNCPNCSRIKYTEDKFINELKLINKDIIPISKFTYKHEPMTFKCNICNHEWSVKEARQVLRGSKCPECNKEKMSKLRMTTNKDFISRLQLTNKYVEPLEEYHGDLNKLKCKCLICEEEFYGTPRNLLQGRIHKKCANNMAGIKSRKSNDVFLNEVSKDITLLEEYTHSNAKILCKCNKCGNEWRVRAKQLVGVRTSGCPTCAESKGEKVINKFCSKHGIHKKRQKTYSDLRGINNKCLRYDFYLKDYNLLIEYQGQFHDRSGNVELIMSDEEFAYQQEHDRRKREYASKHNIKLLEIWYWDFDNIETILKNELNIN